jgi:hypothetical protein
MAETYTVDGTDVSTLLTTITSVDGWWSPPPMVQSDYSIPGRSGMYAAAPWAGPRVLSIDGVIVGSGGTDTARREDALAKLAAFADKVYNDGNTYTVSRTLGATTKSGTARYLSGLNSVTFVTPNVIRVSVDIRLLGGYWNDGSF